MEKMSGQQLELDVVEILKGADLTKLSVKAVRRQLEEKYDIDLTDRKQEIDALVLKTVRKLTDAQQNSPGPSLSNGSAKKSSANSANYSDSVSDLSSDSELEDAGPPKKKVKKKQTKTTTPDDTQVADNDEELARQLQEQEGRRSTRSTGKKPSREKKKKPVGDGPKKPPREFDLSPILAEVMGKNRMSRADVVKRMWEISRERNLLDPKNRQFMICDEQLHRLFGRKRVKIFGMMKYLTEHIFRPGEYEQMIVKK